jgi:hypothetical protein
MLLTEPVADKPDTEALSSTVSVTLLTDPVPLTLE